MTLTQRIFALRTIPGFDQLSDDELLAIAAAMTERRYAPGASVISAGSSMWHLLVVVEGRLKVRNTLEPLPPVVGVELLLTNQPAPATLVADDCDGALCLRMSKGHFFTTLNECPAFLVEMTRFHAAGRLQPSAQP